LLAYSDSTFVQEVFNTEGLPQQTSQTISDVEELTRELARIRTKGYALDVEEYAKGLYCCAAPVFDVENKLAGTIGLSVLELYFSKKQLVNDLMPVVTQAADSISEVLGATRRARTTK
jgi:DNA-binding IclR family transcriptional regulator